MVVRQELEKLNIESCNITLGEVETKAELPKEQIEQPGDSLTTLGFELLDNNKQQLIEKIKNVIIKQVHNTEEESTHNYSEILSKTLHKDYSYLSSLFSEVEGITIEKYVINQKIEKVKELTIYDQLSLGEIAYKLGYAVLHIFQINSKKSQDLLQVILKKLVKTNAHLLIKFKLYESYNFNGISFHSYITNICTRF